jgi:3-phenylpropionate/cinnamic acid dioxygenase small subunit
LSTAMQTMPSSLHMTRSEAEDLLFHEALLLDQLRLEEWLQLFTSDGLYWVPIDDSKPISSHASLVYDTPLRREERVYHLLHNTFPAQSPRSRTVHLVSNVIVEPAADSVTIRSSQVIYEMRTGDFKQVGLGDVRPLVASVEHILRPADGRMKIAQKRILLINRDTWQGNMTFII